MDRTRKRARQAGFSLLETIVAAGLLCAVASGLMALSVVALTTSENQGHLVSRTSEYSQDKMEQLLALAFNDSTSNTAVIPTSSTGGVGLTIGGSSNPSSPSTNYVDYLDSSGDILTSSGSAPSNWFYIRVWSIAAGPAGATNEKLITVTTEVQNQVGTFSPIPESTVTALKVNPF